VIELARRTTAVTRREEGCVLYRFTSDLDVPQRFILTELWESEDDVKAHFARDAFKNFWAELPPGGNFVSSTAWQGAPHFCQATRPGRPTELARSSPLVAAIKVPDRPHRLVERHSKSRFLMG
jgi:hypothetical protein